MAVRQVESVVGSYRWIQNTEVLVAIGVLCVLTMMVVPLPSILIDTFIAFNLVMATVILLATMYVKKAVEFTVYPTLLLITTVYRLAIEVSTSRKILLGEGDTLHIVKAFGSFVVGGNLVVGIVIFLILTIIQVVVVIRGTTRVSEVAARFTLDSMPGKQMAIDADLAAGHINQEQAHRLRAEIRREADFYGAMDGASRFVQGDVWALLIITVINIIGGLTIGVVMRGEPLSQAVHNYTIYTVGSALSSQIPAFLICVATGILVSRSSSTTNLGTEIFQQLTSQPSTLYLAALSLLFLALLPGFPRLPLIVFGIGVGCGAYYLTRQAKQRELAAQKKEAQEKMEKARSSDAVLKSIALEPLVLEVGWGLIPLIDKKYGGDILDRIGILRHQIGADLGIIVPSMRIRDNIQLKPYEYLILLKGQEVGRFSIKPNCFLALQTPTVTKKIEGEVCREPIFGVPAVWIEQGKKDIAESMGYSVIDGPTIIVTHLSEIIKREAPQLLSRQDVQKLIDTLRETHPALINELIPNILTIGEIQKVLVGLLRENVSIRDLATILEVLADYAPQTKDLNRLIEYVRVALGMQLTSKYKKDGKLRVITVDPYLEERFKEAIKKTPQGEVFTPDIQFRQSLLHGVMDLVNRFGLEVPFLCSPGIRLQLRLIVEQISPHIGVLSYNEIPRGLPVEAIATLKI